MPDSREIASQQFDLVFLEEWKECRETIRAHDNIVTHVRSQAVLVSIALMAIGVFLTISDAEKGLLIEFLALAFLLAEYYIERHYKGYLRAAVKRASALERVLMRQNSPLVDLGKGKRSKGMISEVLSVQREHVYGFFVGEAHHFLYLLLFIVDGALIVYSSYKLGASVYVNVSQWIVALATLIAVGVTLFALAVRGWVKRKKPPLAE
jgi:hypothetical protein